MSENHVGEIFLGIRDYTNGAEIENFLYAVSSDVNAKAEDIAENAWGMLSGEEVEYDDNDAGIGKVGFFDAGMSYNYFIPFNSDENKLLFVKYGCNGKHFEYKLNPEGNIQNLAYTIVHDEYAKEKVSVSEKRGIAMLAKSEDLDKAPRNGSHGNWTISTSYVDSKRSGHASLEDVPNESNYKGFMYWQDVKGDSGAKLKLTPFGEGDLDNRIVVDVDKLKEESVAVLYSDNGNPRIEEVKWNGLEKTIAGLEARDNQKD